MVKGYQKKNKVVNEACFFGVCLVDKKGKEMGEKKLSVLFDGFWLVLIRDLESLFLYINSYGLVYSI